MSNRNQREKQSSEKSMSVRIAIVEDDDKNAETLQQYIRRYAAESGTAFSVIRFSDGMDIVTNYKPVYDIILLDIQMKLLSGMDAAEYIRKLDKSVILIFITNMAQYALKGYAVDALDFLLKPVPYFAFSQQLKRSVARLEAGRSEFLLLPIEDGMVKLDVSQIVFIESLKHRLTAHTRGDAYSFFSCTALTRGGAYRFFPCAMKDLESSLDQNVFSRCNNCYLVNLAYVKAVKGDTVTVSGHDLAISRLRKKTFLAALAEYVGKGYAAY
ncbi:MAG: LytTR family DNA-binding domain-containing protein [Clostridiales bacterium]|jgi:DNA-binding LytR/AlgR family response regulator|nr:LytTR family DNA-binding domain-containing protein [Clostridiales bacterium]